jgi:hypothetical protein
MSTLANLISTDVDQGPPSQDWGLIRVTGWELHFCMYPRKCFLTGKLLWLKKCYKGTYSISGWDGPLDTDYYVEKTEFIFWNLRGKQ